MKAFDFFFAFFLLGYFTTSLVASQANNQKIPKQISLQNIDKEIDSLNQQLTKLRKETFNQEMQAQPYMFDNWKEFSEDIGKAEEAEKKILIIKEKIKALEQLKQFLIKKPPNSTFKSHEPSKHL